MACPECGAVMVARWKGGPWPSDPGNWMMCPVCVKPMQESGEGGGVVEAQKFTHQDEVFLRSVELGCTPVWLGCDWQCRCAGAVHGVSTTYTVITKPSLERAAEELGKR